MRLRPLLAAAAVVLSAPAVPAQTIWQFDGNITAQTGAGTLVYYQGATTSSVVSFGTASSFGLPVLPGGNAQVLSIPAFTPQQGLLQRPGTGPNGGGQYVNLYTMGFDVLIPNADAWFAFYNTADVNQDNADFFRRPSSLGGGIGITDTPGNTTGVTGGYDGTIAANTWYRIMFSMDLTTAGAGTLKKYINGTLVGTQTGFGGRDGNYSLYSSNEANPLFGTLLFTDGPPTEIAQTTPGFINSVLYSSSVLSDAQILAYGGPTAGGFPTPVPEPSALVLTGVAAAGLAWRRLRTARPLPQTPGR